MADLLEHVLQRLDPREDVDETIRFIRESSVSTLLTAPVICSMVVPIALLDLWISI